MTLQNKYNQNHIYVSKQYNVNLDMIHTYIENMSIQNKFSLKIMYIS